MSRGINDRGDIVGQYDDGIDSLGPHGYLRTDEGRFITIDVPGATDTRARGINDRGSTPLTNRQDEEREGDFFLRIGKTKEECGHSCWESAKPKRSAGTPVGNRQNQRGVRALLLQTGKT
ncbi:MAG TPA: hypothetical protein VER98_01730 [Terriglobia bacterium]|nr:hypothetical protein [Terriglobia bacterium]